MILNTKLWILSFLCLGLKTSFAVDVTCEYSSMESDDLINLAGPQYACYLKSDFPYIVETTVAKILGEHITPNVDTNVAVLTVDEKKIYQIPNLITKFSGLIYINITKTPLRYLQKWNLDVYKSTLQHLFITHSEIEVIEKDLFKDFAVIKTLDLRNNHIFYIADGVFDGLTLDFLALVDNECKDTEGLDIGNLDFSSTLAVFIPKITSSTCKFTDLEALLSKYQETKIKLDLDVYEAPGFCNDLMQIQVDKLKDLEKKLGDAEEATTKAKESFEDAEKKIVILEFNVTSLTTIKDECITNSQKLEEKVNELNKTVEKIVALESNVTLLNTLNDECIQKSQKLEEKANELNKTASDLQAQLDELESTAEKCIEANGTCRYTVGTYGYTCMARNFSVTSSGIEISWTGTHTPANSTNRNVLALIIRDMDVYFMPSKIGDQFIKLVTLIIKNCKLTKLATGDFAFMEEVETIEITLNEITSIESGVFDSLTKLKTIDLSENKIKTIPTTAFSKLTAIQSISLDKNLLTSIRADSLPTNNNIQHFSATNNQLKTVESSLVWKLRNATNIDFSGNGCDHKLEDSYIDFYTKILTKC